MSRPSRSRARTCLPLISSLAALALAACDTAQEIAGGDAPGAGSVAGAAQSATPPPAETAAASDDGGGEIFAAILGTAAAGALIVAGASGDVGQAALASAAASASDPMAASIASGIQTATAPAAAANEAARRPIGQQTAYAPSGPFAGNGGGGGSCDPALAQVDSDLAAHQSRITDNVTRMEALMWAFSRQIDLLRRACPQSEPYTSLLRERQAQLEQTQRTCNAVATKGQCQAQLPSGSGAVATSGAPPATFAGQTAAGPGHAAQGSGKKGCSNSSPGHGVCTAK